MPPIHQELWDQYGGHLPSDQTLLHELIMKRNFTATGAKEFASQFRKTIEFAELTGIEQDLSSVDEGVISDQSERMTHQSGPRMGETYGRGPGTPVSSSTNAYPPSGMTAPVVPAGMMAIPIPLIGSSPVQIVGEFPISERAWSQFLRVLEAMKPGLVASDDDPESE